MELLLRRSVKTEKSTIGKLLVNGKLSCLTLEDKDRDLVQTMSVADIAKIKVFGKTAVPRGRYEVRLTLSNRFKRVLPELLDVPGFAGIRIHTGNKPEDTEGCILAGSDPKTDWVGESRVAFEALYKQLEAVPAAEKIFITIE